jgi:hypothetical protein
MIVLDLACSAGHRFEGWFASAAAFAAQAEQGLITCPGCGDVHISRLPAGPRLVRSGRQSGAPLPRPALDMQAVMRMLRNLAAGAENVGDRFPEEARRIHYQEAPARGIRGQASLDDTLELLEEGIAVLPVPPEDEPLN